MNKTKHKDIEDTPIPTVKATPRQPPQTIESPKRIPGFIGLEFLVVIILFLYKKKKREIKQ